MLSLEDSYAYAEKVARKEAKNFYYTFLFLPPEKRRSLYAVYTYSRRVDDAVDSVEELGTSPEKAAADLAFLERLLDPDPPEDPLSPALSDSLARFSIPREHFDELIAGMRMDLDQKRYETFDDLYRYCYRAASVVGLICIEVFGYDGDEAEKPAEELGIAMQLTNIIRDVAEDLDRGRIYLPQEDLRRFEVSEDNLQKRVVDQRFRDLIRFQLERARDYFERAEALFPMVHAESRYCPVLLKRFYSRILDRIEKRNYDVLSRRPRLPLYEKLRLAAGTWLESRKNRAKVGT
ncbi:MAG: phytoene/squalene synthase family protein [Planctomycetota bacterium]